MRRFSGIQLKAISINTFIQLLLRIATSIPTLLGTLLVAYVAGYEMLGSFTKIVAFVSVFYLIADFGMNSVFLKEHFEKINRYFGNLVLFRLLFTFALVLLAVALTFFLPENRIAKTGFSEVERYGIILFSLTIITTGLTFSLQTILQKKLSYYVSLVPSILSSIVLLALIVVAAFRHDLNLLLFSYVASGAVLVSLLFVAIKKKYKIRFIKTKDFLPFSERLFIMSLPLGAMLFFNLLYAKADMFLLSIFKPNFDVGVYGISYKFFEFLLAIPTFLSNSVYPLLLLESKNSGKYYLIFKRYSSLFVFVSFAITILSFFCAPLISLLKPEFVKSVVPLQILSLSLPFFFLTSLLQWHFLIRNKIQFLVPLYGGALFLNIFLNVLLIPRFTYFAAAVTTGICETLVFVIMLWYFMKDKKAL
jgi:O-antigen/teichoic acid export membrane protein